MVEHSGDRRHVSGFGGFIMQRIAITVFLSALVAACGQQSPAAGEAGAPVAELDFIEAVPIVEDEVAPVAQPRPAAKKEEPEEDRGPAGDKAAEAAPAPTAPPSPEPAADDATSATRRANETTATPDVATAPETPSRPDQM